MKFKPWIIEFRNGSFFQSLESESGGDESHAQGFETKEAAEAMMSAHEWIAFAGGMAVYRNGETNPRGTKYIGDKMAALLLRIDELPYERSPGDSIEAETRELAGAWEALFK